MQGGRSEHPLGEGNLPGTTPDVRPIDASSGDDRKVDPAAVRAQLERVLRSAEFDATDRMRSFLRYVVEETLAGRAERIKAYTVAIDVFHRTASFDAHADPIVRVEAGHLRRALARYYATSGHAEPIEIAIPKGGYAPTFEFRHPLPQAPTAKPAASWRGTTFVALAALLVVSLLASGLYVSKMSNVGRATPDLPRLLVRPFEDLNRRGNSKLLAQGLTQEILGQLAKFKDLVAVEEDKYLRDPDRASARYTLFGSVNIDDDRVRIQARVVNRDGGSIIWSENYESDLRASQVMAFEVDIARQVATALGQPYGVIYRADLSRAASNPPDDWGAYACTLEYYAYRVNLDAKSHPAVRKCLETAVARFPSYATAWALLSQTYIDEIRFHYAAEPPSPPASLERALAAARRAVEIDPDNVRGLQAQMLSLWFAGQHDAALEIGKRALALNPNDTELAGEYGFRLSTAGHWSEGCALLQQTREHNPGPLGYFEVFLGLCSYFRGDYAGAATWLRRTPLPENNQYHLVAAAIFAEGGQPDETKRERDWLIANAPTTLANIRQEIATRYLRPEDQQRLIRSLAKAGLLIPPE